MSEFCMILVARFDILIRFKSQFFFLVNDFIQEVGP